MSAPVSDLDPRTNAARADLADIRLQGRVIADRFVAGRPHRVVAPSAPLRRKSAAGAPLDTEILKGEIFTVFETAAGGLAWGQLETDGYVGYVPATALSPALVPAPTHHVGVLRAFVYSEPDMRSQPLAALSFGAAVAVEREVETRDVRYLGLAGGEGWVGSVALAPAGVPLGSDYVAFAERFLGAPYLWGGRTSLGLDCSALVQLSLAAVGKAAPRDSDLQEKLLGSALVDGVGAVARGDLLFWPGHVAICRDRESIVHATGTLMAVVIEPLAVALRRVGQPRSVKRP
jgi:cell wall-associated NlpC family hydrolase